MEKLTETEFKNSSLERRYKLLKNDGEYIAGRQQGLHRIHLFTIYGFYVELWVHISFDQIHWIEVQNNKIILEAYANGLDLKEFLK